MADSLATCLNYCYYIDKVNVSKPIWFVKIGKFYTFLALNNFSGGWMNKVKLWNYLILWWNLHVLVFYNPNFHYSNLNISIKNKLLTNSLFNVHFELERIFALKEYSTFHWSIPVPLIVWHLSGITHHLWFHVYRSELKFLREMICGRCASAFAHVSQYQSIITANYCYKCLFT